LIDKLVDVRDGDVGYSPSVSGTIFLPLDTEGQVATALLGQEPLAPSETLRLLVKQGAAALPHLIAHLDDGRPTGIQVGHAGGLSGLFYDYDIDRNKRTDKPPPDLKVRPEVQRRQSHTVTVGDLCFVAVGQIVNRRFDAVRYIPSGIVGVTSPTQTPGVRRQVKQAWGSLTREQHRDALVADFVQPDSEARWIGACKRLAYYYPDALEPLALKVLARPNGVRSEDRPRIEAPPDADKARLIGEGLIYDRSEKIDRAVRDLLLASGDDDYLAASCIRRLIGRGYDEAIEGYCRRRLPRATSEQAKRALRGIQDRLGWTRLHVAAERQDADAIRSLLHDRAKVDAADRNGLTPLHVAARAGNLEAVRLLVGAGASLDPQDKDRLTPVQLAVRGDHLEVTRYLAGRGCKLPGVLAAAVAGRADLVAGFLRGDPEAAEQRTASGQTPLHLAAWTGQAEVAKVLAGRAGSLAEVNGDGMSPLQVAALAGSDVVARELVRSGASAQAAIGRTGVEPLHLAAERGHVKVATVLLDARASPEAKVKDTGQSPLHLAAQAGQAEMVDLLLKRGAAVNAVDADRRTPLHLAALAGRTKAAERLLAGGAAVGARDWSGSTPLHLAVRWEQVPMVKLLLAHKADPAVKDEERVTPLDLARGGEQQEIIELLEGAAKR
jgi:ankyrin repeat protein